MHVATWEGKKKPVPEAFVLGDSRYQTFLRDRCRSARNRRGRGGEVGVAIAGPAEPLAGAGAVPARRLG